ncbi:hypothetical protein [Lacrimispora sphenoides]|nr:hypothetical protein [Lacrimispora sphenoides]
MKNRPAPGGFSCLTSRQNPDKKPFKKIWLQQVKGDCLYYQGIKFVPFI